MPAAAAPAKHNRSTRFAHPNAANLLPCFTEATCTPTALPAAASSWLAALVHDTPPSSSMYAISCDSEPPAAEPDRVFLLLLGVNRRRLAATRRGGSADSSAINSVLCDSLPILEFILAIDVLKKMVPRSVLLSSGVTHCYRHRRVKKEQAFSSFLQHVVGVVVSICRPTELSLRPHWNTELVISPTNSSTTTDNTSASPEALLKLRLNHLSVGTYLYKPWLTNCYSCRQCRLCLRNHLQVHPGNASERINNMDEPASHFSHEFNLGRRPCIMVPFVAEHLSQ